MLRNSDPCAVISESKAFAVELGLWLSLCLAARWPFTVEGATCRCNTGHLLAAVGLRSLRVTCDTVCHASQHSQGLPTSPDTRAARITTTRQVLSTLVGLCMWRCFKLNFKCLHSMAARSGASLDLTRMCRIFSHLIS